MGLPALPGLRPGRHEPAQPAGRRSRRVARQEQGRDDVGVRRRHRRAARLPRQARLPPGLDRADLRRRRESAARDGAADAHGARRDPSRRSSAGASPRSDRSRDRDDQDHAGRLLPEPLRHLAVGRGQVERGPGECQRAAGKPRLPGHRQQPVRHLRRLADRRLLGQPGGRRLRAEHGRLPGAQRHVLHRRRGDLLNGFQTNMQPDLDDGLYLYHFLLDQAGPQGQRRDRAAPADPGQRRVELRRQRPDAAGDVASSTRRRRTRAGSSTTSSRATRRPRTGRR